MSTPPLTLFKLNKLFIDYIEATFLDIPILLHAVDHRGGSPQYEGGHSLQPAAGVWPGRAQQEPHRSHAQLQQLAEERAHW